MPQFEIIEAKPFHVGMMLRRMRTEHREALMALGIDAHRELRKTFDNSSYRRAWLIDGKLSGLGGVTGTLASSFGRPWLTLSQDALRYPIAIVREAKRQLNDIAATHCEIATTVLCADYTAQRFASFLGFHPDHIPQIRIGSGSLIAMVLPGGDLKHDWH